MDLTLLLLAYFWRSKNNSALDNSPITLISDFSTIINSEVYLAFILILKILCLAHFINSEKWIFELPFPFYLPYQVTSNHVNGKPLTNVYFSFISSWSSNCLYFQSVPSRLSSAALINSQFSSVSDLGTGNYNMTITDSNSYKLASTLEKPITGIFPLKLLINFLKLDPQK